MHFFEKYINKSRCWWCGGEDLSGEHKQKKTDLVSLYGKDYKGENEIVLIKHRTDKKGKRLQSPSSKLVKFRKHLCIKCNGTKSQKFDFAYEKLNTYYLNNQSKLLSDREISLSSIYQ